MEKITRNSGIRTLWQLRGVRACNRRRRKQLENALRARADGVSRCVSSIRVAGFLAKGVYSLFSHFYFIKEGWNFLSALFEALLEDDDE